jgi:hypothetical protein
VHKFGFLASLVLADIHSRCPVIETNRTVVIAYNPLSLGGFMDIVKALDDRASVLRIELNKIQRAIRAMAGTKIVTRSPTRRKFRHTAATKQKLRLAQKKIWATRRKRK